jgi:hypothetical protein
MSNNPKSSTKCGACNDTGVITQYDNYGIFIVASYGCSCRDHVLTENKA